MRSVVIEFRFAVGSLACMISGASDIRCIVTTGASCLLGISIPLSVATLCSSTFVGVKMAVMAFVRLLTRCCPLVVFAAVAVDVINSLVRALICSLALRFGTWQCCGNSLADPEMRYAHVSGT